MYPFREDSLNHAAVDINSGAADLRTCTYICKTRSFEKDTTDGLVFFLDQSNNTIFRWAKRSRLTYFVSDQGLSATVASYIKEAMAVAASNWASTGLAISFQETLSRKDATFLVVYNEILGDSFARAFFPGGTRRQIDLGLPFFDDTRYMSNILTHELGHVLGLRHEHWEADRSQKPDKAYRYPPGAEDDFSVMNHKHANKLELLVVSECDRKLIREFYDLPTGRQGDVIIEECDATPYQTS